MSAAFTTGGLKELGWLEGKQPWGTDYRWAPDDAVLVWKFAQRNWFELRPDVIVAPLPVPWWTNPAGADPQHSKSYSCRYPTPSAEGLVGEPSRRVPVGNVTGFYQFRILDEPGKWVEFTQGDRPGRHARLSSYSTPRRPLGGGSYFLRPIDAGCLQPLKVKSRFMALVS